MAAGCGASFVLISRRRATRCPKNCTPPPHDPSSLAASGFLSPYREPTVSAYRNDRRCFWTWCAEHDLQPLQARRSHLELYLRDLQDRGYAAATISRRLSTVAGLSPPTLLRHSPARRSPPESSSRARETTSTDCSAAPIGRCTSSGPPKHEAARSRPPRSKRAPSSSRATALPRGTPCGARCRPHPPRPVAVGTIGTAPNAMTAATT